MHKLLLLGLQFSIFITIGFAQNINMSSGSSSQCSGNFYDSGGSGGNYGTSQNFTYTICAVTSGDYVELNFSQFVLNGGENFTIYDANSATGSPIFQTTSAGPTGPIVGTSGCLTIVFTSSSQSTGGNGVAAGWTAAISCSTPPDYILEGDASLITVSGQNCIELTPAANSQTGCAWSQAPIDFSSDFTLTLDYYFGNNPGGADGSTFTFQPNNSGCGDEGAQLGAGGVNDALIIEFDTYDNDGGTGNDLACDHISVEIDSDLPDDPINFPANSAPYCGPVCAIAGGASIENGASHEVQITWNATTEELEVIFDGNSRLTCSGDFVNSVFNGDNLVYWGATAATGGLNNQQYFCPATVIVTLPSELDNFTSICDDEKRYIYWNSDSEYELDYYKLEYTYDGYVYYPYHTIHSAGNTNEVREYKVDVTSLSSRDKYFRLTMVDINGEIKNTELIQVKDCTEQSDEISTYFNEEGLLTIESENNNEYNYYLLDINGKVIQSGNSENGLVKRPVMVSKGVYLLKAEFISSKITKTQKLVAF